MRFVLLAGLALASVARSAAAQGKEPIDDPVIARIKDEGIHRSQVMEHIVWLADVYGPRLTGSPAIEQAAEWAKARFKEWGLAKIRQDRWPFGKGWVLDRFSAHLVEPQSQPMIGYPKSWSPGTAGPIVARVVRVAIDSSPDFAKYRGQLKGTIALLQPLRRVRMLEGRLVLKMTEAELREAATVVPEPATAGGAGPNGFAARMAFQREVMGFLQSEGVVAVFDRGSDGDESAGGSDLSWTTQRVDGGTIFVGSGGTRDATAGSGLPMVTLAVEHYNRMVRILERGVPVKVELDIRARFLDEKTPNGFNLLAEIPGTDLADQIVLIGGHFDSEHSGTGATDNATGAAAMMEAMRILKTVGARPRRTIRIGLWGGEEQGLLGSQAYVRSYLGDLKAPKPGYDKLAAYYNIDNGTGRIRGIWMQKNDKLAPIFEQWLSVMGDLGVTTLGPRAVSSTDHVSFTAVGLSGFQFMHDRLEYNSRTHHSNMDVVDRVQPDDMRQMATVAALFAYLTAMRDDKLPR